MFVLHEPAAALHCSLVSLICHQDSVVGILDVHELASIIL